MLISKFDLYKPEWLELVFDKRNKAYGAYELRQHNSRTIVLAMIFTFLGVGTMLGANALMTTRHTPARKLNIEEVDLSKLKEPDKKLPPPVAPKLPKPQRPVATVRFPPLKVMPDKDVKETPPKIEDLTVAISTVTKKGDPGEIPVIDVPKETGPDLTEDGTKVYPVYEVQVMPSPVGGEEAWAKFLNKNLRFPEEAQQDGVSGRVFMSFIIEKDGSLTNITVDRSAGHGFDEEATRVLKLAKNWKPGLQNGRPVRVKFEIPINFQITDQP